MDYSNDQNIIPTDITLSHSPTPTPTPTHTHTAQLPFPFLPHPVINVRTLQTDFFNVFIFPLSGAHFYFESHPMLPPHPLSHPHSHHHSSPLVISPPIPTHISLLNTHPRAILFFTFLFHFYRSQFFVVV